MTLCPKKLRNGLSILLLLVSSTSKLLNHASPFLQELSVQKPILQEQHLDDRHLFTLSFIFDI